MKWSLTGFATKKNRLKKAKKIEAVLRDFSGKKVSQLKILDVGCGKGIIARYFSKDNQVFLCDSIDQRIWKNSKFKLIKNNYLPYKDNDFDICISNHVIEHLDEQENHIKELKRVTKKGGLIYLATPNPNFPIEPHYKIPLIHLLPLKFFEKLIRLFFKDKAQKIKLIGARKIRTFFGENKTTDYTPKIIANPKKYFMNAPKIWGLNKISFLSPTLVIVYKK